MTDAPTGDRTPKVRKDVARNRALLLEAADRLLATSGLDLTFHELAASAGVGVGTVYRHFSDKDELLGALVDQRMQKAYEILIDAERIADPIEALRTAIVNSCEYQFGDRAVWQAVLADAGRHRAVAQRRLLPVTARIIKRAIASGRLRPDFKPTDLPMIFLLMGAFTQRTADVRPELWKRYLDVLLDGFVLDESDRVGPRATAASEAQIARILSPPA